MRPITSLFRTCSAFLLACVATLAGFGLVLSALWSIGSGGTIYKFASALVSAIMALGLGGMVMARISKPKGIPFAMLFGLLFGGSSFIYILGLEPESILLGFASGLAAGAGGLCYIVLFRRGTAENPGAG
jgi:hypothetical protein